MQQRYGVVRDMELLHTKFLKNVFREDKKTSGHIVYGKLVYSLEININYKMINVWVGMIIGRNSKLSYLMSFGLW